MADQNSMKKQKQIFIIFVCGLTIGCSLLNKKSEDLSQNNFHQPGFNRAVSNTNESQTPQAVVFFDTTTLQSKDVQLKSYYLDRDFEELSSALQKYLDGAKQAKAAKQADDSEDSQSTAHLRLQQFVIGSGLVKPYNEFKLNDKSVKAAVKASLELMKQLNADEKNKIEYKYKIAQLLQAVYQKYTPPIQTSYELLKLPVIALTQLNHPKAYNNDPFYNLDLSPSLKDEFISEAEISRSEPTHFYSLQNVDIKNESCEYFKSKKGYGVNAGYQIQCKTNQGESVVLKVKFGKEEYSGPFNSRIYKYVGYQVPTIIHVENFKIKYDRRMLTEYNDRSSIEKQITLAGAPVYKFSDKMHRDPFKDIQKFILKDQTILNSEEMKTRLINNFDRNRELKDTDFDKALEAQIDSVVINPATLTLKEKDSLVEVGPWSPEDLNYKDIKYVRSIMLLSSWVGNYDVRKDNLRVYLDKSAGDENIKIRVGFTDIGSGLGHSTIDLTKVSSSKVNDMVWEMTRFYPPSNEVTEPMFSNGYVELQGITNIEATRVFQNINLSDATWMIERICRISKTNILEALTATGMSSAEVRLGAEKLLNRRNKMLEDFKLDHLKQSCYVQTDKKLNYDSQKDGLITVQDLNGQSIVAPDRNLIVRNGQVVSR